MGHLSNGTRLHQINAMDIFTVTKVTSKISARKSVKPQKCLFVVEFER